MSKEPNIRDLLGPMIDRQVDLESPEFKVDRERVIARMALAGRRDYRAWAGVALAVAAGVALVLFGSRLGSWLERRDDAALPNGMNGTTNDAIEIVVSEGRASQSQGDIRTELALKQLRSIAADGELETAPDSKAHLHTVDGLSLDLGGQTRIAIGDLRSSTRRVTLFGGALHCSVPHPSQGGVHVAFQVIAPDVTVIDQGTVFSVDVDPLRHTTRISVEEGEVVLRQASGDTHVQAPGSWTNAPSPADAGAAAPAPPAPPPSTTKANPKGAPAATLSLEARLLRQGLTAERQGRFPEAIAALTQLTTKYPQSPLAPDARAALSRIEARAQR